MPKLSGFRITKRAVDDLKTDRDAIYFDAGLRGFAVRTKPSGAKSYLVQYQSEGRTRRVTLGSHGELTPNQAREHAIILLGKVRAGGNPAEDKKESRSAITVRRLAELYLDAAERGLVLGKRGAGKKQSTLSVDRGRIQRHILPLLGNKLVVGLTTPDIVRFMRDVASGKTAVDIRTGSRGRAIVTGGKGTAARTVGLLGGMLSFAVSEGITERNVARGVKRPADERRIVRLSPEDFKALGLALRQAGAGGEAWQAIRAIQLLAVTGCRRGEVEGLRWSEVDLSGRALRLGDTKTGASVRPLGHAAIEILETLPRQIGFVFPSIRMEGVKSSFRGLPKAWGRIVQTSQNEQLATLTPHGLRHAFASIAHDLGYTEFTIAALLGHASSTVTGRYVHHVDDALVAAADRVSGHITKMMNHNLEG